ncbi:MAG: PEP-CTERM sorting domain-containing protein, partial [Akkermansiaceae bacterium]
KYTILALAVTSLAANAATVKIGFGTVTGDRDAGQASPIWGQSATADYLSTPAGPHGTVYLNDFSYQAADDGTRTTGTVFLHAYTTFTTDEGSGAITNIDGFAATSTSTIDLGAIGNFGTMTWTFSGANAFVAETEYYFLMSTSATEVTIADTSSMKTAAFALDIPGSYDGGEAFANNSVDTSSWDQHFEANFNTDSSVPEPSSTALLGLGGLALILRRRK